MRRTVFNQRRSIESGLRVYVQNRCVDDSRQAAKNESRKKPERIVASAVESTFSFRFFLLSAAFIYVSC